MSCSSVIGLVHAPKPTRQEPRVAERGEGPPLLQGSVGAAAAGGNQVRGEEQHAAAPLPPRPRATLPASRQPKNPASKIALRRQIATPPLPLTYWTSTSTPRPSRITRYQWHEGQKAKARCTGLERLLAEAYDLINMVELQHVRLVRPAFRFGRCVIHAVCHPHAKPILEPNSIGVLSAGTPTLVAAASRKADKVLQIEQTSRTFLACFRPSAPSRRRPRSVPRS